MRADYVIVGAGSAGCALAYRLAEAGNRVIGVDNLRVVDSSIFPRICNGNLNAPSIMVGEKAADMILGKPPLPADNAKPWIHPNWQTAQR